MQLSDYLGREGLSYSEFARRIGSRHARTVERYAKGRQIPDREKMDAIVRATSGDVTPNDFFGLSSVTEQGTAG